LCGSSLAWKAATSRRTPGRGSRLPIVAYFDTIARKSNTSRRNEERRCPTPVLRAPCGGGRPRAPIIAQDKGRIAVVRDGPGIAGMPALPRKGEPLVHSHRLALRRAAVEFPELHIERRRHGHAGGVLKHPAGRAYCRAERAVKQDHLAVGKARRLDPRQIIAGHPAGPITGTRTIFHRTSALISGSPCYVAIPESMGHEMPGAVFWQSQSPYLIGGFNWKETGVRRQPGTFWLRFRAARVSKRIFDSSINCNIHIIRLLTRAAP